MNARGRWLWVCVVGLVLAAGCKGGAPATAAVRATDTAAAASPAPPTATLPRPTATEAAMPEGQAVSFMTEDSVRLVGRFYPAAGGTAVIFAHMGLTEQSSWQEFAGLVASRGVPALTFDFRCYGDSECTGSNTLLHLKDMQAAMAFLGGRGYRSVMCVGASLGGEVCASTALHEELAGLVVIAGPQPTRMQGKSFPESLVDPGMPKLFIVTEGDRYEPVRTAVREMYDQSPEPKALKVFPGVAHGTELFFTEQAEAFRQTLLDFILEAAANGPAGPEPTLTAVPTLAPLFEEADLKSDKGPVYSHEWSPDGKRLALAGYEKIKLWSLKGRKQNLLAGHSSYVWGVSWSPDGKQLASASQDGTVRVWDTQAYTQTAVLATGWAFSVDWSPDGRQLAVGTQAGVLQIWDADSLEKLADWESPSGSAIISLGWSPDGTQVASGEWSGAIYLWEAETGLRTRTIDNYSSKRSDTNGLAWSPDGRWLATAHQDGVVRIWDPQSGKLARAIDAHQGWARGVAWSPDGKWLASSGEDKRACIWEAQTGQWLVEVVHNFLPVWSVAFSADGVHFSSGSGAYEELRVGATIVWRVVGRQ
ncbi:MAG: hypothetical protein AB1894_07235 [Chloroflexota bacterium]